MVYDINHLCVVCESESPDFKLRHCNEDKHFGVEITEFYLSDSDARIKNIPGYMSELFSGRDHRHKNDVENLKVEKARWRKADGSKEEIIDVIWRELPEVSTVVQMISTLIGRKSTKLSAYEYDLSHVNLIILDHSNRLITTAADHFYEHFFTSELRKALANTGFREVYFVTVVEQEKKVFIPLKALFLMSEFYLFHWALSKYQPDIEYESVRAELDLFVEFMREQNVLISIVENTEGTMRLLWGNYGVSVSESNLTFTDYADFDLPKDISVLEQDLYDSSLDPPLLAFLKNYRERNTFISNLASGVLKNAHL